MKTLHVGCTHTQPTLNHQHVELDEPNYTDYRVIAVQSTTVHSDWAASPWLRSQLVDPSVADDGDDAPHYCRPSAAIDSMCTLPACAGASFDVVVDGDDVAWCRLEIRRTCRSAPISFSKSAEPRCWWLYWPSQQTIGTDCWPTAVADCSKFPLIDYYHDNRVALSAWL